MDCVEVCLFGVCDFGDVVMEGFAGEEDWKSGGFCGRIPAVSLGSDIVLLEELSWSLYGGTGILFILLDLFKGVLSRMSKLGGFLSIFGHFFFFDFGSGILVVETVFRSRNIHLLSRIR